MTLEEITNQFNAAAEKLNFPLLGITDCDYTENIEDDHFSYEFCGFHHYYTNDKGDEYDLGFDDYGDHGYWTLFDHETDEMLKNSENPFDILACIER